MKLYTYFRSSASYRVRIALNLKSVAYDPEFVQLRTGEQLSPAYKSLNPQGFIPALETAGGDVLTQSLAILEYIDETCPEPPLLPAAPVARAKVRAMAGIISSDIHPVNNLRILKYLKDNLGHDQGEIDSWYRHWIAEGFTALEKLVERSGGEYCYGDTVTLADVCLAPQMWNARRFEADLTPYPRLTDIDARLVALPAFRDAAPENQPDFA